MPDPYAAWAHRVLTGDTLADKLVAPSDADSPAPSGIPDVPGRPPELRLPAPGASVRAPFPSEASLVDPDARGRALHFFANHELLALELMALAIVRFPEAPPAFHRRLVNVMADEQRHLGAYLARMAECGVRFGDLPVNRFFWDALRGADATGLVAGLSLTFEQANLDFAAQYAAAFRRAGDVATAQVLDGVLADEVRHVAHGLAWFDRWRDPARSRWDAWVDALPHPLTPARARGARFHVGPRRAAGLDDDTILRVRAYGASKGRPPRVYSFHPEIEADVGGLPPTPVGGRVASDLAPLLAFQASDDDLVLVPRAPTPAFRAGLADLGFPLPEIVEGGPDVLRGRMLGELRPWGWSPAVCAAFAPFGAPAWDPGHRRFFEKSWAVERRHERPDLCDPSVAGRVCTSVAELRTCASERDLVKAPLGTAGRGNRRWGEPGVEAWAERVLSEQGTIVVEPWLDRVLDLSVQIDVGERVRVAPWGRFLTDGRGHYRGAVLGDVLRDQPSEIRRLLAEEGPDLAAMASHVGEALRAGGFRGAAGIDALVHRTPSGYALQPLVEVNPRCTMGRVAAAIGRRVRRDRVGLWTQVSKAEVRAAGGFVAWAEALRARASVEVEGDPPQIRAGAVCTTDPATASGILTVLVVGEGLERCLQLVRP